MRRDHLPLILGGMVAIFLVIMRGKIVQLSKDGLAYIARKEGFSAKPYNDPPGSQKWSIGYGHQIRAGENLTNISVDKGLELLAKDTASANATVGKYITAKLTQPQHDALVSLVFNIGSGNFSSGTIPRKINSGDFRGAAATIKQYNKIRVGSELVVNAALTARRNDEARPFEIA